MTKPLDIVCLASADFDAPVWVNVQHLMQRLSRQGHRVLYVESLGLRTPKMRGSDLRKIAKRFKRLIAGPRQVSPTLRVLAPQALPGSHLPWVASLNQGLLTRQLRAQIESLGFQKPILWMFLPTGVNLIGQLGESAVVYHCVDDYLANPSVPVKALAEMEDRLSRLADRIVVTSAALLDKFKSTGKPVKWIPSGVDVEAFEGVAPEPEALRAIAHPRVVFSGNLVSYKIDFQWLEKVIAARPAWQFVLMGGIGGGEPGMVRPAFLRRENVHYLGEKNHSEVPRYLAAMDVGIIPYRLSATTKAVFPVKLFEYFAAGLPVVSTPIESLLPYIRQAGLAQDPNEFVAAIETALQTSPQQIKENRALARANSWDARVSELLRFIEQP